IDLYVRAAHAVELLDGHGQRLCPATAKQSGRIAEFELHADALALYLDRTHASGADRILVQMGVGVLTQYRFHSFTGDGHDYSKERPSKTGGHINSSDNAGARPCDIPSSLPGGGLHAVASFIVADFSFYRQPFPCPKLVRSSLPAPCPT